MLTFRTRRARTRAADLLVLVLVLLFAWLGLRVHDAVGELGGLGRGVTSAGISIEQGFGSAAGAVQGAPVVGGTIAGALRDAGRGTGGQAASLGREGERSAAHLARLLGWLTFLLPAAVLLIQYGPGRLREARRRAAGRRVLATEGAPERERLIALRAALSLPYEALLRHTSDPLGDFEAGRYAPLVRAAREDAGLETERPPEPLDV